MYLYMYTYMRRRTDISANNLRLCAFTTCSIRHTLHWRNTGGTGNSLEEVVKVNGKVGAALGVLGARRVGVAADARVHVTQHVHARTLLVLQS